MQSGRATAQAVGPLAVFVVAVCVRAAIVLHSAGGAYGDFGYDESVYYSAADALIHGRMPYGDFILLHPPAIMLVLTPFAWFGTLTSDHLGFVLANGAFTTLGGVNAVLVVAVARRAGAGRPAALTGGLFYALWPGAAVSETSVRLEPLGNLFLLCGLLVLVGSPRGRTGGTRMLVCGALLGAAVTTKIWGVVPLVVLAVWATYRDRRQGMFLLAAAVLSATAIAGPFFAWSPRAMWHMVVRDQLERSDSGRPVLMRLRGLTSLNTVLPNASPTVAVLILLPIGALVVAACVRAWRRPELRPIVALAAAQLFVLLAAPVYFNFYADYVAPAGALVLAGAVAARRADAGRGRTGRPGRARLRHAVGAATVVVVAASAVAEVLVNAPSAVISFPGAQLAQAASREHLRCVMADSPMALIELDVLSSDLAHGCPDRVDVSGSTYGVDRPRKGFVPRVDNQRWQHDLYRYLTSGNAEIVIRSATGIGPSLRRRLARLPAIASAQGYTLRRTP